MSIRRTPCELSEELFVSQARSSYFWGSLVNFSGTSGLLLESTVREAPGKLLLGSLGGSSWMPQSDLFSRVLFSFLPPLLLTPLPHLFSPPFRPFSNSKSALFCRANGTAQSLERGSFRMDLSTKFGKEIPSRNLRKKRSAIANDFKSNLLAT